MERKALDRKPNLSVRKTFRLDEDTEISEIGMTVRKQVELSNNKSLSDTDRGIHLMAAKILVNGNRVIYDDLMDCFSSEEMEKITNFLFPDAKEDGSKNV